MSDCDDLIEHAPHRAVASECECINECSRGWSNLIQMCESWINFHGCSEIGVNDTV